uniref:(northern house mosquito) hypothetical protein n=2 Tax=Culex pipiens TaxID=7175 RepID=A0A8D7ZWE8_CULPI
MASVFTLLRGDFFHVVGLVPTCRDRIDPPPCTVSTLPVHHIRLVWTMFEADCIFLHKLSADLGNQVRPVRLLAMNLTSLVPTRRFLVVLFRCAPKSFTNVFVRRSFSLSLFLSLRPSSTARCCRASRFARSLLLFGRRRRRAVASRAHVVARVFLVVGNDADWVANFLPIFIAASAVLPKHQNFLRADRFRLEHPPPAKNCKRPPCNPEVTLLPSSFGRNSNM